MDGVGLSPAVREALEFCVQIRFCQPGDLDSKIVAIFQGLPDDAALRVLNEFVNADISSIRSPTGYIVGIIRKLGVDSARIPLRRFHDSGRLQPNWRPAQNGPSVPGYSRPEAFNQAGAKRPREGEPYGGGVAPSYGAPRPYQQQQYQQQPYQQPQPNYYNR